MKYVPMDLAPLSCAPLVELPDGFTLSCRVDPGDARDGALLYEANGAIVGNLDAVAVRVAEDMGDDTINELAQTALPAWHDFKFEVQRLRADYLLR
jgi:hypothetical protein